MTTELTPDLIERFVAVVGEKYALRNPEDIAPFMLDHRDRYFNSAQLVLRPGTVDEISQILKLATETGVAIVPQGGNSGMSGGATPDESGDAIVLSLRRMNAIVALDRDEQTTTCEAGVILQTLHEAAANAQLRFPLTLGGKGSATIGGLISTNAGGTQVLRHGTMRAQVIGLEAVLPDGQVFNSLTPLKKDNRGFDLKQLLIGSEGTLGIVTGATLRLLPEIAGRAVLWAGLNSITDARKFLLHCQKFAGEKLEGFEVLPAHSLAAVLDHLPSARAPLDQAYPWNALIELVGTTKTIAQLHDLAEVTLATAFESKLIADATIAANETQADAFWLLRDSISPAERAIGPAMQHDISVPVDRMAQFVETAVPAVEARFPTTTAVAFGHLGDGNVHFHVIAPPSVTPGEWEMEEGKLISGFVHDLVTEWDGSISAEHGIGQMKVDELGRLGDPAALSLMRSINHALAPLGLFNPGKLVPAAGNS